MKNAVGALALFTLPGVSAPIQADDFRNMNLRPPILIPSKLSAKIRLGRAQFKNLRI